MKLKFVEGYVTYSRRHGDISKHWYVLLIIKIILYSFQFIGANTDTKITIYKLPFVIIINMKIIISILARMNIYTISSKKMPYGNWYVLKSNTSGKYSQCNSAGNYSQQYYFSINLFKYSFINYELTF